MLTKEALELYDKLGFCVIPITHPKGGYQDGKRPAIPEWMGYMTRHATPYEKNSWWSEHDEFPYNLGVITGTISNIAVIDLDDEESYRAVCSADNRFMDTLTVKTGKGFHIYFRPDKHTRTITFILNTKTHHLKQEGGYVVAPPSRHMTGRNYEFIDIREPAFFTVDEVIESLRNAGAEFTRGANTDERSITWASDLCQPTLEGGRNTMAAQLCGLLIRKFAYDPGLIRGLMNAWNQVYCKPPLDEWELKNLVESEYKRYGPRA